jgi:DnaD/phage-associated family protein
MEGQWWMMAKYRMVRTDFWTNPIVMEEMSPEDRYFYIYLQTNAQTTQSGIYRITKKQMAFELGYSIESVHSLMERFILHYKLIRYNPETRELAIKNWGKENLDKGGKPVMDCIESELKEVEDLSLISYVAELISKPDIRSLYESLIKNENEKQVTYTYETESDELDDSLPHRDTIRGQKEKQKEKENEKEKQQQKQKALDPNIESNPEVEISSQPNQKTEDVKEIIEFWDVNGFGFSNTNAKQQLLAWLDDSHFVQPKEFILKAMSIACANNKRKLNYVVGILKNWENESLLTIADIDSYERDRKPMRLTQTTCAGRAIPSGFILDLTAGEDE